MYSIFLLTSSLSICFVPFLYEREIPSKFPTPLNDTVKKRPKLSVFQDHAEQCVGSLHIHRALCIFSGIIIFTSVSTLGLPINQLSSLLQAHHHTFFSLLYSHIHPEHCRIYAWPLCTCTSNCDTYLNSFLGGPPLGLDMKQRALSIWLSKNVYVLFFIFLCFVFNL
jgi:hypothetical protein